MNEKIEMLEEELAESSEEDDEDLDSELNDEIGDADFNFTSNNKLPSDRPKAEQQMSSP